MILRLIFLTIIFSSCQRMNLSDIDENTSMEIDTMTAERIEDLVPGSVLSDLHNLLSIAFDRSGLNYDSLHIRTYFDPNLKDSIRIQSPAKDSLYVTVGNYLNAKVAIYSYLDILGYRFYGPEDHWTFFPDLSYTHFVDTTICSHFKMRNIIPSYSLTNRNIKQLKTSENLFERWRNRLRMIDLTHLPKGHYGSEFNRKYKEQIIEHPEWRGTDKSGNSRNWSVHLKLCYSHPGVIDLYKQDALRRLKNLQKSGKPPYILSMEPPDGGGFCQCKNCENKSISDQVYGLANQIAQFLTKHDEDAMVSLYGYNEHATAPSFQLESNVIVGIVPFAFQSVGSPETMMNKWESTGATLYLRDYLAIPVWNLDQATYRPNTNFLSKIEHIKDVGYLGYVYETTTSFMAVGLQFYLLSQASWKSISESNEFELFLDRFFPGYQDELRILFENLPHLNNRTFASAQESIHSILSNPEIAKIPDLQKRLKDLEYYIEYLFLLSKYNSNKTIDNVNILYDKIFTKPGVRLLHPYGLYRVLQSKTNVNRNFDLTINKPIQIPITEGVQLSLRRRTDPKYHALHPEFYLEDVSGFKPIYIRNVSGILYVGDNHGGKVKFRAVAHPLNSSAGCTIIIREESGSHIQDIKIPHDNVWRNYEVQLPPGKFYKIEFRTPGVELQFQGPNRPFAFDKALYSRYLHKQVPFYFMVPADRSQFHIQVPLKSNRVIVKSNDRILFDLKKETAYLIDIQDQEGQIIEILMYRHGLKLIGIPHLVSLHSKSVIQKQQ